jgi:hypothetical protein
MQHDGSRVGNAGEGRGHHSLAELDFGMFKFAINLLIKACGEPRRGQSLRGNKPGSATGREARRNGSGQVIRRAFNDVGFVFAEALNHQLYLCHTAECAALNV